MPSFTDRVRVPAGINPGLNGTRNSDMIALLGNPRGNYNQDCQPITNTKLKARMKTASFGPFRATGFDLAVESLKAVMMDIKSDQPNMHAALSTAGMLCCRNVRDFEHGDQQPFLGNCHRPKSQRRARRSR